MAAFAAMCDGEPPEEGFAVASKDGIALNAIDLLHGANYDTGKALQGLLKTPFPDDVSADPSRKWPDEDVKEFIKGLKLYGKNFFKIREGFLPHRETPELVEFYYLWKKTPGAANNRPRGRFARKGIIRGVKGGKSGSGKSNRNEDDPDDLSSCSEELDETNENGDGENGDLSPYYCRHCYATSSRDWHHAGKQKLLVCLDCRIYFKKYGELPCLEPPTEELEEFSTDEEDEEDIKPPTDKKLDLNAIEQDSNNENYNATAAVNGNGTMESSNSEPLEIKGELPKSIGLVSPVPTMPAHVNHPSQSIHPHLSHAQVMPPANLLPGPPPAHSNSEVQVLPRPSPNPPPSPSSSPPRQTVEPCETERSHQTQHS